MSENMQENILKKASELFYRAGIKSVSVDDICHELGMSKKTFYVYFTGKDDLVEQMLRRNHEKLHQRSIQTMQENSLVEIMRGFTEQMRNGQDVRHIPQLVYDLQKYYPQLFESYQRHVFSDQKALLQEYIQKGIEEGIFRSNIDAETVSFVLAKLHSDTIRDGKILEQEGISLSAYCRTSMEILVRGILSPQGMKLVFEE